MIGWVAVGSALGGVLRYFLGRWIESSAGAGFPWATLSINVSGSFLLGVLQRGTAFAPGLTTEVKVMLTVGLCGGFTTFSTFSAETLALLESGHMGRGVAYAVGSVVLSVVAVLLGSLVATALLGQNRVA